MFVENSPIYRIDGRRRVVRLHFLDNHVVRVVSLPLSLLHQRIQNHGLQLELLQLLHQLLRVQVLFLHHTHLSDQLSHHISLLRARELVFFV